MARPHVVLASDEVFPFVRAGGIGRHVAQAARLLAEVADVTIVTNERFEPEFRSLSAAGDERLPPARFAFAAEVEEAAPFTSVFHARSAAFFHTIREVAREHPVDLVEVEDYHGLGAVVADARRGGCAELASAVVAVRLHTTWEMTAVLDRQPLEDAGSRWVMACERTALRLADVLVAPAAGTAATYRSFYGRGLAGRMEVLAPALAPPAAAPAAGPPVAAREELRLLFAGRLQALKGAADLVRAVAGLDAPTLRLDLVGGDTASGPDGGSMREHLEALADGDPRIVFHGRLEPAELEAAMARAHVVVLPSHFDSYGYVLREAQAVGRPVLTTPVGGLADGVRDGVDGWLADGVGPDAIRRALVRLLDDPGAVDAVLASGEPRRAVERAADPERWRAAMLRLAGSGPGWPAPAPPAVPPTVARDVPCTAIVDASSPSLLPRTLASLAALEGGADLRVLVTCPDPALLPPAVADHVQALVCDPDPEAAWAAALDEAPAGPVLTIRAGQTLLPTFLTAARAALAAPARPAYATAWATDRGAAARPLGNAAAALLPEAEPAGTVALVSRAVLTPGLPAPPRLLTALADAGHLGTVIPAEHVARSMGTWRAPKPGAAAAAVAADLAVWS